MPVATSGRLVKPSIIPPLMPGDHLTAEEFERRYDAMPEGTRADLLDGRVFMPPVHEEYHGDQHNDLSGWLCLYKAYTPGVIAANDTTIRLSRKDLPQPDLFLRIFDGHGGTSRRGKKGIVEGPPELAVEVAASSVSYDLHEKLDAYQKFGVCEYLVWRTYDNAVDWFVLQGGKYRPLKAKDGILRSTIFGGLWLNKTALLGRQLRDVLSTVQAGIVSPEHAQFVARLAAAVRR